MSNASALENRLLKTIEKTIATYKMFENSPRTVFIGFSGGKDSLATALLLAKLGYLVHDLVIDMGAGLYDLSELREKSFNKGVNREIISVRNPAILNFLTNQ